MDSLESNTCIFLVEIWTDIDEVINEVVWRGSIKNVKDKEFDEILFTSLDDLPALIQPFLEAQGVRFGYLVRMKQKLRNVYFVLRKPYH